MHTTSRGGVDFVSNGKGDDQRPISVPRRDWDREYDRIFQPKRRQFRDSADISTEQAARRIGQLELDL